MTAGEERTEATVAGRRAAAIVQGRGLGFRKPGFFERSLGRLSRLTATTRFHPALQRTFEAGLWLVTAGRGMRAVLPHGEVVRLSPRCRALRWNAEEYEAFRAVTQPGDIVVDAGANVGAYTVLFAQWVGRAGRVYAFEPVPAIARVLRRQLALNGVADRVTVVPAALASGIGTLPLVAPGIVGVNRAAVATDPQAGQIRVSTTSLDEFCVVHRIRPSVLKIDVEGTELDVLKGARLTIAANPALHLFVEWHPSLWPGAGVTEIDLKQELSAQRLVAEPLRDGDAVWRVEGICARVRRIP